MLCLRPVAFTLCALAWKVSFPVAIAGVLVGIILKESDSLTIGVAEAGKGSAVFSDQGTKVLVTLGNPVKGNFSTCVIKEEDGRELAFVKSSDNGQVSFEFGVTPIVRGSGVCRKNGAVAFGVTSDVNHQYDVSVQPDGSSVVHVRVRDDQGCKRVRTVRFSPSGDVLKEF